MKLDRYACIGVAALAYAIVGGLALFFFGHPEHEGPIVSPDVEVQSPIPHKPVQEYEVD